MISLIVIVMMCDHLLINYVLCGLILIWYNQTITEMVVGEAVVVIKKLIQLNPKEHKDLIVHVAKLVDTVTVSTCGDCRALINVGH